MPRPPLIRVCLARYEFNFHDVLALTLSPADGGGGMCLCLRPEEDPEVSKGKGFRNEMTHRDIASLQFDAKQGRVLRARFTERAQ